MNIYSYVNTIINLPKAVVKHFSRFILLFLFTMRKMLAVRQAFFRSFLNCLYYL